MLATYLARKDAYLRENEIFTPLATFAGVIHCGVWNVTAVARAAPACHASPGNNPIVAVHGFAAVVQLRGMSVASFSTGNLGVEPISLRTDARSGSSRWPRPFPA